MEICDFEEDPDQIMRVRTVLEAVSGSRWWTFVNVRESQISSWAKKPRREEKPIESNAIMASLLIGSGVIELRMSWIDDN